MDLWHWLTDAPLMADTKLNTHVWTTKHPRLLLANAFPLIAQEYWQWHLQVRTRIIDMHIHASLATNPHPPHHPQNQTQPNQQHTQGTRAYFRKGDNALDCLTLLLLHASVALRFFAHELVADQALRSAYHLLSSLAALLLWCVRGVGEG